MNGKYDFKVVNVGNVIDRETTKGWSFNATISEKYIICNIRKCTIY